MQSIKSRSTTSHYGMQVGWPMLLLKEGMPSANTIFSIYLSPRKGAILLRHLALGCSVLIHYTAQDAFDAGDSVQGLGGGLQASILLLLPPPLKRTDQCEVS